MHNRREERSTSRLKGKRAGKKWIVIMLGTALLVQPISLAMPVSTAAAATVEQGLAKLSEEMITSGAKLIHYKWSKSKGGYSNVHVIEVDLTNPYVKLDVMNGKQDTATGLGSVGSMVKNSGAVAGVNADFFNTAGKGSTLGGQVSSGTLISSPSQLTGMYAFAINENRKPVIDLFSFKGMVTSGDGTSFDLDGVNKAAYQIEPGGAASHANKIYMYTSAWTVARPTVAESSTTPTEVLVVDGIVQQVIQNGVIQGSIPTNGYILRTHGKAATFALEHLQVGQTVNATYSLLSNTTNQAIDPSKLQMLVGGHTILVDQGKTTSFSRDTKGISGSSERSRTAIGYTQDSGKVLLITVEDVGSSDGMTLTELQQMMVKLGVWKGINLDGGGSTTMISRPLGEVETGLAHPTENGSQRGVANGVGVFSTAPKGQLRGIKASGANVLFVGQQASYQIKGYDTYYNPIDSGSINPVWSADGLGVFNGNTFTATKSGTATIQVKSGDVSDKLAVEIIGGDQLAQMTVDASSPVLEAGKSIALPVRVTLTDGRKLTLPASSVKWEFVGFSGTVKDGTLTINSVTAGAEAGYAIARYDGFSAVAVLAGGADKKFEDFEQVSYPITFQGTPNIKGTAELATGVAGRENSKVLQLSYDFSAGTGTKAAYAVLNGTGRKIEGAPSAITLDVKGDESLNWLRAEFIDGNGKAHLVTLADKVNWSGWKQIKAPLPADKIAFPVTLKRIYVASIEEGQDERALTGSIALDNVSFQYAALAPEPARQRIVLSLGSKSAQVGSKPYQLDVAPIALNGTTYLPLRFVTETMGAQVNWEPTLKRVSVLRGNQLLEMWLGKKGLILSGVKKETDVAPISRDGRTLVPIRLVSEQLGLLVKWEGKTNTITVE